MMKIKNLVIVRQGRFRLWIYPEGGCTLNIKLKNVGWVYDDESPIPKDLENVFMALGGVTGDDNG